MSSLLLSHVEVLVTPFLHLFRMVKSIKTPVRKFYTKRLTNKLRGVILQHFSSLSQSDDGKQHFSKSEVKKCEIMPSLDSLVTL